MPNNVKILLSNNPDRLAEELAKYGRTGTVEAEYGDVMVEGSVISLGHHGPRSGNPCPCLAMNQDHDLEAIGASHIDLDMIGGVAALLGIKPTYSDGEEYEFWSLAAHVDLHGPHRIDAWRSERFFAVWNLDDDQGYADWVEAMSSEAIDGLNAWWAWKAKHPAPFVPRDGSVVDMTEYVMEAIRVLGVFLADDGPEADVLRADGRAFKKAETSLNRDSFVRIEGGVILRRADAFANHLYVTPGNEVGLAVVNIGRKDPGAPTAVTISLADPVEGVSCQQIVRALWGPLAGGHAGIGGSPRNQEMTMEDAEAAFRALKDALAAASAN